MPLETVLAYSLGIIGFLLSLLIALIVYVFVSLRGEVHKVASDVRDLTFNRPKLMHRDDCRVTTTRIHDRLDEHEGMFQELGERVARIETQMEHAI